MSPVTFRIENGLILGKVCAFYLHFIVSKKMALDSALVATK